MDSQSRDEEAESREDEADVETEAESRDEEAERAMAPKKLRIHGEATVPDAIREPTSEGAKALIVPNNTE